MTVSAIDLGGNAGQPLLVLGPSLGTSADALWSVAAGGLAQEFQVIAWDLPGHGVSRGAVTDELTMADLARQVLEVIDAVRGPDEAFHYAGDSVGGCVGLQLLLDAPSRVLSATLCCTGAKIGTEHSWRERIATVRASGTPSMVAGSAQRWFAPGFLDREPDRGSALLHALSDTDDAGYAAVCAALARFDVRARLAAIDVPVLAIAGACDEATPPDLLNEIARGVQHGRCVVLPDVAHLAPIENPDAIADLIVRHAQGVMPAARTMADVREAGMAVRRAVLGDAHVDRAVASSTAFTADFQAFITEYAWGGVWTRPGLDRRARSMITLTALIARGHHDELAMHVRAARTNGLTVEEISEVILQSAIYCGVPDANTAFKIAQETLRELGDL